MPTPQTAFATCPLCEATCGLQVGLADGRITDVRGDADDVFSHGYICPKGASIGALHDDPDRLTQPMLRRDGVHVPVSWDEAFAAIDAGLNGVIERHGRESLGIYLGNPGAHNLSALLYNRVLIKAMGTKQVYSASTVDQMPKHLTSGYLYGDPLTIPIPDLDRTQYLLVLGANPLVSNGSLMTAPDVRGRLRAIRQRGGKVVVVDPRRSRTAEVADEHLAIRPGTDALLLFALVDVLFDEGLVDLAHLDGLVDGVDEVRQLAKDFPPEVVAPATGIAVDTIRRIARELAAADSAAVYGRIGTTTQEFGTLASWLVDVVSILTGNLDRAGGTMFPLAAAGQSNAAPGPKRAFRHGRWTSRLHGRPEIMGEFPVAGLADEILTPGDGQVRALITVSGNPVVSTPHAARLDEALADLEFMVSLDVYLNETTRHADVILPGPVPFARGHFDLTFYQLSVRNVANWTPPLLDTDVPQEWQTILRLVGVLSGQGPDADIAALDAFVAGEVARRAGLSLEDAGDRVGPERIVDLLLRSGPYDLTLAELEAAPHGIDLGPLQSRLPGVLSTASGRIDLVPEPLVADVPRLLRSLEVPRPDMVLIGRRQLNSNNSWMHNVASLVRGSNRCTAQVHPDDAARLGLADGADAMVRSRTGEIRVPVEVTDSVMAGVVSVPHGWGHDLDGVRAAVATAHAGVNVNLLADDRFLDVPSGNAAFSGIPVEVAPA
ncbi:MAG: molybdopterin oxidoreductase family protein [Jatrophihabitans sp.]|uniref:molybdopterin oxidoreductase family protein n=1 Tax=Jatrophihabitans sp. TaxID=1932789 RepID=UPI003F7DB8AB